MSVRSFILLVALVTLSVALTVPTHAVPAAPKIHVLKQPDGTTLQARLRGDEWLNWWETLDGRVIARDPKTGWWGRSVKPTTRRYPPMPPGGDRTARQRAATGDWEVPVICIKYPDTSTTFTAAQFQTALFGNSGKTMRTFYTENSYGVFTVNQGPSGVVGWYTASHNHDYYGYWGGTNWAASQELVREAVLAADAAGFNFGAYDNDGNGYIEAVCIIHQGAGTEASGSDSDIWSHRSAISPLVTSSGKIVSDYIMNPETLWGNMSTIGVYCHEYGHGLGLPDLYDYDYDSSGVDSWSVMAGGNWNGVSLPGDSPAHMDAWCKTRSYIGWITPTTVTTNLTGASVANAEGNAVAYKLNGGSAATEYFLVENRQLAGFDAALPGSGLLIYHIDDTQSGNNNQWYPGYTSYGNYLVAVEQADGLWELEQNGSADAGDPYPGTTTNRTFNNTSTPNSKPYNQSAATIAVTNISNSASTMTADFTVGGGSASKDWTFLVYLDGDNNLESYALADETEMQAVGTNADVNIVLLRDLWSDGDSDYRLVNAGSSTVLQNLGEVNMGNPATLQAFIEYGITNYPADKYALVLWDHGGGWRSRDGGVTKAACWDDNSGGDCLYTAEQSAAIQAALTSTGAQLELLGYDVCLAGMIEIAHEMSSGGLAGKVKAMVGSPPTEPGDGWPYNTVLGDLAATPTMSGVALADAVVTRYHQYYGTSDCAMGAYDLTQAAAASAAVSNFADTMLALGSSDPDWTTVATERGNAIDYYTDFLDLRQFLTGMATNAVGSGVRTAAASARDAVAAMVHSSYGEGWYAGGLGISVYFPASNPDPDYNGSIIRWAADTSWDEFLGGGGGTGGEDAYEVDDTPGQAKQILTNGTIQHRNNYSTTHKDDYAYFDAVNGAEYTIETLNLGSNADTYLYVYDTDGTTILDYNDDGGGGLASRIVWTCPASGRYYVRERPYSDSRDGAKPGSGAGERTGANATYDLKVTGSGGSAVPDLLVKTAADSTYVGDGIYNSDGTGQTKARDVAPGLKATYQFLLYNDGATADSFKLTGPAAGTGWAVKYYMSGAGEQTAAFTGGGYTVSNLAAGAYVAGWFDVYQLPGGGGGVQQDVLVTAASVSAPSSVDAVKGVTSWGPLPDLMIKNSTETSYVGDGIYNTDGAGQSKAQGIAPGLKARYCFLLYNDGPAVASFKLTGPAAGTGWAVKYYVSGAGEQTAAFTGAGYSVTNLASGASLGGWFDVYTVSGGGAQTQDVLVTATSVAAPTDVDAVKATTTTGAMPDLLIKASSEASYCGDNIYNADGASQTKSLNTVPGSKARYCFLLYNDSPTAASFKLTGPAASAGWGVKYYISGQGEQTSAITGAGYTVSNLASNDKIAGWFDVYPLAGGGGATTQNVLLTASAVAVPTNQDAVKGATTWGATPDLLVKVSTESSYIGDGIYNADGAGQARSAGTMALQSSVKYCFLLYNDGPEAASFKLTGPAAPTGWSVRYYMSGQGEQTTAFTGSGYTVSNLASGGYVGGWVTVAPEAVGGGATKLDVLVKAAVVSSPLTVDAVKSTTTWLPSPDLLVRKSSESTLIGDNIRNTDGTNQTKSQTTPTNTKATYIFAIYNDGPAPASFKLAGPAGSAGWSIRYFIQGAGEQTTAFTGSGFTVSNLAVGYCTYGWVEVTPGTSVANGSARTVLVTATSTADATCKDVIKTVTTKGASSSPDRAVVAGVIAVPTRAGGADILFSLSAPATVEARVLNVAGRPVRTLCAARDCAAGMNNLLWNAQSDGGLAVPNGTYLVEIRARTASGADSRAVAQISLRR